MAVRRRLQGGGEVICYPQRSRVKSQINLNVSSVSIHARKPLLFCRDGREASNEANFDCRLELFFLAVR
jgi:hypothetical protein